MIEIILLGDKETGKSTLLYKILNEKYEIHNNHHLKCYYRQKKLLNGVHVEMFDTNTADVDIETFCELYCKKNNLIFILCDASIKSSWEYASNIIKLLNSDLFKKLCLQLYLIVNKTDKVYDRIELNDYIINMKNLYGVDSIKTSSKFNKNIYKVSNLIKNYDQKINEKLKKQEKQKKSNDIFKFCTDVDDNNEIAGDCCTLS